jgi:hypothetical protein
MPYPYRFRFPRHARVAALTLGTALLAAVLQPGPAPAAAAPAAPAPVDWRVAARQRIEQIRKGNLTIRSGTAVAALCATPRST